MPLTPTPSQTVGPFFSIGFDPLVAREIGGAGPSGERVTIAGRVLDGDGRPVPDAVLEIWQADAKGRYVHPEGARGDEAGGQEFTGFLRVPTNDAGEFRFTTVKPGRVAGPNGTMQAPHLAVTVFMRGLLKRLVTRIYFADDVANANDFALSLIEPARRGTLLARRGVGSASELEWNVVLQGEHETVFFDI